MTQSQGLLQNRQFPHKISKVLRALVFCLQRHVSRLQNTQIWNSMWEWAEKPKPQSQLMTIGFLESKMKYPLGSCKKTTLGESWLSSNSPMPRLLSSNGKFYQRVAEQNLCTTLALHHYFLFAPSSWSLWTASQKILCHGELQADGKIWHKICKKCSGEMTGLSLLWPPDFCTRNWPQRDWWTQLGGSPHITLPLPCTCNTK